MAFEKSKFNVEEIDGVRCRIVEAGISEDRMKFLTQILEFNRFVVKSKKDTSSNTYLIGVTDILFNPVYSLYEKKLLTLEGKKINTAYWNQKTTIEKQSYWEYRQKAIIDSSKISPYGFNSAR